MLVMLAVCGGCFVDVDFGNTRFSCAKDGSCPGGYECVDGTCVTEGPGGTDGGGGGGDTDGAPGGGGEDASAVDDGDASIQVAQCGVVEVEIALDQDVTGTTVGGGTELDCGCTDCSGAEVVHRLVLGDGDVPVTLQANMDLPGTGYDTIIYARTACDQVDTELGCNDDGTGDVISFEATEPGIYYFIVDSHDGQSGTYELQVTKL
jgi:hypothetical protein